MKLKIQYMKNRKRIIVGYIETVFLQKRAIVLAQMALFVY